MAMGWSVRLASRVLIVIERQMDWSEVRARFVGSLLIVCISRLDARRSQVASLFTGVTHLEAIALSPYPLLRKAGK
jgi:hypothetical protein